MTAREVALNTLAACERQGAWSDGYFRTAARAAELDGRDAALSAQLCYGVLQNRMLLDFYIGHFSTTKPERMELKVKNALRLGIYQMVFLTRIPHSAAVNESVNLTRKYAKNPKAAGLVNGVLRSLSRGIDALPVPTQGGALGRLSVLYSHPLWLVEEFCALLGQTEAEALLRENNTPPPLTAQVNTLKTNPRALTEMLEQTGCKVTPHATISDCLLLEGTGALEELPAFREGLFYIQDAAAHLVAEAAELAPGLRVLDVCAAPGGKSFAAAIAMGDRGEVLACDLHPRKKALIDEGAGRLGLQSLRTAVADAVVYRAEWANAFDRVLADVPCSGLGVIGKKPDIRYRDPQQAARLPALQGAILDNAARYVAPGGALIYSTCTLRPAENEAVVAAFLQRSPHFLAEGFVLPGHSAPDGLLTLWPHRDHTDGFFIAKLRRRGGEGP